MDPTISKTVVDVTAKVAESIVPAAAKKVLSWMSGSRPRKTRQRAEWERRRAPKDRRISGVGSRLRRGFWLEYHRKSGAGKTEIIPFLTAQIREHLLQAVVREGRHYEFSERTSGVTVEPCAIADAAIDVVWTRWKLKPRDTRQAVIVVEAIADYLFATYNVRRLDRRESQRRAMATV